MPLRCNSGGAALHIGAVEGRSVVLSSKTRSPVCLLTPRTRSHSVWAYTSSLGGGMVAGDDVQIEVKIDENARCFLGTQASTKIYRNPFNRPCSQQLKASVARDALLVLAPDPVQCFSGSSYEQRQSFELAADANLIFVDWISAGRLARGERWKFRRYFSRNEVRRGQRRTFVDAIDLDVKSSELNNRFRTGRFNCLAMVFIQGPMLRSFAERILKTVHEEPVATSASLLFSASAVPEGVLLRFAGGGVEQTGRAIYRHLQFVRELLEDDPWLRKW